MPTNLLDLPDELLLQILTECIPAELKMPDELITPDCSPGSETAAAYSSWTSSTMTVNKRLREIATDAFNTHYTHNVLIQYIGDRTRYDRGLALPYKDIRKMHVRLFADYMFDSGVHPIVQDAVEYLNSFPRLCELHIQFEICETDHSLVATKIGLWNAVVGRTRRGGAIRRRAKPRHPYDDMATKLLDLPDELLLQILRHCIPNFAKPETDQIYSMHKAVSSMHKAEIEYSRFQLSTLVNRRFRALILDAFFTHHTSLDDDINAVCRYGRDFIRYKRDAELTESDVLRLVPLMPVFQVYQAAGNIPAFVRGLSVLQELLE
ncbi:hypothetical protein LTR56_015928 [Elasticomyces elasticus]|nr:hypothetical protein LTR56_015928 [Elasticomyces elasticus]KAK3655315.1 hypothetical protein LTR22_010345 [Elasticomyces elasticus]KAK4918671.1 hypothetical protein LTR49_013596 [Elasticomyces elasticus]